MKTYRIEIVTVYSGLDEATLDDYLKNSFQQMNKPEAAEVLKTKRHVQFESVQPDGKGLAVTDYMLFVEPT